MTDTPRRRTTALGIGVESLQEVARAIAAPSPKRTRRSRGDGASAIRSDAAARGGEPQPGSTGDASTMDLVTPARSVPLELVSGRGHYDRVIDAIRSAHTSVWIATANVKELMIEDGRARPGRRRSMKRASYVSVLAILDDLAARGVELRLLHAELPSRPFREEIANHPRLLGADDVVRRSDVIGRADDPVGLALRRCPRVHMKVVVIDGELLYLGSANWTGAGLGAKGSGRRNFELGIVTSDAQLLDQVQSLYDHVWRGAECEGCRLRAECPGPLIELGRAPGRTTGPAADGRTGQAKHRTGRSGRTTRPSARTKRVKRPAGRARRE